eukprot:5933008-Amphidinium_carterae.1
MLKAFGAGVGVPFVVYKGKWQVVNFGGFWEGGTKLINDNCNQVLTIFENSHEQSVTMINNN